MPRFSSPSEPVQITLAELSIEAFYPANAQTGSRLLEDIGAAPGAGQA
jgi:hypothetical protein